MLLLVFLPMLHELLKIWFGWVEHWGYAGVFVLMAMESSIIPVPSEVVMPPAAFWAAQGRMEFWGVVLAGTAGSLVGSVLNYWAAGWLGRPFINRFGRYVLITPDKVKLAESWIKQYGAMGIFVSRLLPVVRHLISIPAGMLHMPFGRFVTMTTVGAGLWCWILSLFGQKVIGDRPDLLENPDALVAVMRAKLVWFVVAVVVLGAAYAVAVRGARKGKSKR